jgi:hypothetical protein
MRVGSMFRNVERAVNVLNEKIDWAKWELKYKELAS